VDVVLGLDKDKYVRRFIEHKFLYPFIFSKMFKKYC
jgi:hypothetical protein